MQHADGGERGDPPQLAVVEPAEQRHALQVPQVRVAGRLRRAGVGRLLDLVEGQPISGAGIDLHGPPPLKWPPILAITGSNATSA